MFVTKKKEAGQAALVLIIMLAFMAQAALDEMATNQQITNFIKFRSQVASVCEMVKVTPGELHTSSKEFIVLYPFYDIRFYNQTGTAPSVVRDLCKGDKCACLIKVKRIGVFDSFYCNKVAPDKIKCFYDSVPAESVLSCFNMQELGCNYQVWFAKGKEAPIRDYNIGVSETCKSEGVVEWDKTKFSYNKLSKDLCMKTGKK